ncbi:flavodoxin [Clostridium sp.]|uniref:flavodoxin n=1 Tax=Clostridium sp. TaxID=1506 RepID=UPI0026399C82
MKKLSIIYWSGSGNTETMANLIAEGAKENGLEVKLLNVSDASTNDVEECDVLALGSPAMGCEAIEEGEMDPFVEEISGLVSSKPTLLFGSYDWGTGEWMDTWKDRMEDYGAHVVNTLIVNNAPEGEDIENCKAAGKAL